MDKYIVDCTDCDDEISATYMDNDTWSCDQCGSLYEGENGQVVNITEREDYRKLYEGAVIAGMINIEEEFIGDKEQMKHERW